MTSIIQYPDTPCSYPVTIGTNRTNSIGNTPVILAVFRNEATIPNLRALLTRLDFTPFNASADTLVTIQLVNNTVQAVGGTWNPVGGESLLDINKTATGLTGGIVGVTVYSTATTGHGNVPPAASLAQVDAEQLGLVLRMNGQFAIVAFTTTPAATTDLAWTVNWLERD